MIKVVKGNILEAEVEALVNTVNCVGIMGKGIALQFKHAYPDNFKEYKNACDRGEIKLGKMFVVPNNISDKLKYIINLPTKDHWKSKSKLNDLEKGLLDLKKEVERLNISSIAIPPLGCGSGGLRWVDVLPLIRGVMQSLRNVDVYIYEPSGAPKTLIMRYNKKEPNMTLARALYIKLFDHYCGPGYELSGLETQKLAFFLQEAGQDLKLKFDKHLYGPYANNLHHVLQEMVGHFIEGYGDRSYKTGITVMAKAVIKADAILEEHDEAINRLKRVYSLIEGFETPYGLELLASVYWVARKENKPATDVVSAIDLIHSWSERKRNLIKPNHVKIAWDRLREYSWI